MTLFTLVISSPVLLLSLTLVLGLIIGSFLNVAIHRLPIMLEKQWQKECADIIGATRPQQQEAYNLIVPCSHCPACNTRITAMHNIPVISWLLLRGRCANCSARISSQYPLIELTTAILSAVVVSHFGATAQSVAALVFTWALITLSAIDFKVTLLPDNLTLPLLWLGLLCNALEIFTDLHSAVIGAALGYIILWLVYHSFRVITGKEGIGYGDFKLLAALGAWLGWQQLPLVILLSSLLGTMAGAALIILRTKDKNTPIPFGPYLACAGWVALFWGEKITHHYLQLTL